VWPGVLDEQSSCEIVDVGNLGQIVELKRLLRVMERWYRRLVRGWAVEGGRRKEGTSASRSLKKC
jgi:hypothetical protein